MEDRGGKATFDFRFTIGNYDFDIEDGMTFPISFGMNSYYLEAISKM